MLGSAHFISILLLVFNGIFLYFQTDSKTNFSTNAYSRISSFNLKYYKIETIKLLIKTLNLEIRAWKAVSHPVSLH